MTKREYKVLTASTGALSLGAPITTLLYSYPQNSSALQEKMIKDGVEVSLIPKKDKGHRANRLPREL